MGVTSHFGTEYRKAPPPRKGKENNMGIRRVRCRLGLKPVPDERLITVLERARLVWTSLAAKFTECTWSLEASFLAL